MQANVQRPAKESLERSAMGVVMGVGVVCARNLLWLLALPNSDLSGSGWSGRVTRSGFAVCLPARWTEIYCQLPWTARAFAVRLAGFPAPCTTGRGVGSWKSRLLDLDQGRACGWPTGSAELQHAWPRRHRRASRRSKKAPRTQRSRHDAVRQSPPDRHSYFGGFV